MLQGILERDTSLELATYCLGIYAAPTAVDFVGGGVPDAPRMGNPFISY